MCGEFDIFAMNASFELSGLATDFDDDRSSGKFDAQTFVVAIHRHEADHLTFFHTIEIHAADKVRRELSAEDELHVANVSRCFHHEAALIILRTGIT